MPAPEGNTYAEGHGRPTDYRPEYDEQAYKLCLLGHTDEDLAGFFETTEQTINNWKRQYPSFFESLKRGKEIADAEVVSSLYRRATGYQYDEVTFEKIDDKLSLEITPDTMITQDAYRKKIVVKQLPPDTGAALSWLKNRQPKRWRDKQVLEIQQTVTDDDLDSLTDDQLQALLAAKQALAKRHGQSDTTD